VFAAIVLAPFAVMVALGAPQVDAAAWFARGGKGDWALLVTVVLWNTSGWDNAGTLAGEVERPSKTYPAAMAASVLLVPRAYRVPGGTAGALALSAPPIVLCLISMALADKPTVWVSVGGIVVGLAIYCLWRRGEGPARLAGAEALEREE